jgi:small GTP-binding protein
MTNIDFDVIFKIVIVGESGVGKSNLIARYLKNEFKQDTKATVGVEFGEKKYVYNNLKIKAQIWDTAGQERYRSITSMYYKGAKGALCVFDLSSKESFQKVDAWINEMKKQADNNINLILIGNKVDLPDEQKIVKTEEGEMKAKEFGIAYMETSALKSTNVDKAFNYMIEEIAKKTKNVDDELDDLEIDEKKGGVNLNMANSQKKKKCCGGEK